MVLQIIIEVTDSYISLIFKFQQNKIANIANFVYYGKTRLTHTCSDIFHYGTIQFTY